MNSENDLSEALIASYQNGSAGLESLVTKFCDIPEARTATLDGLLRALQVDDYRNRRVATNVIMIFGRALGAEGNANFSGVVATLIREAIDQFGSCILTEMAKGPQDTPYFVSGSRYWLRRLGRLALLANTDEALKARSQMCEDFEGSQLAHEFTADLEDHLKWRSMTREERDFEREKLMKSSCAINHARRHRT